MESGTNRFCQNGGCTAKLGQAALKRVLEKLPRMENENLLVGYSHGDDGAVYRLSEDLAVIHTLDFFPPVVEDPRLFGQIAAANALSDIYAMGGDVTTALNIVCFLETMDLNILGEILAGGSEKVRESGGILAGGHSIADEGIKYGLSVCGTVAPARMFQNHTCREGDALLLTKPLGVGIVCAASRLQAASGDSFDLAVTSMRTLNRKASEILRKYQVHACTDVTGFGLLGHLGEMVEEHHTAVLDRNQIPYIPKCEEYAEEFYLTAAGQRNRNHMQERVEFGGAPFYMEELLFDPQTSGGLLACLDPKEAEKALEEIENLGLPCGIIGTIEKKREKSIYVR